MKKLLLAIFAITTLQISLAQDEKDALRKAAKYYKNLDYIEAIAAYESIARKGVEPQELLENLGNCYYYNADYQQANKWYAKLFTGKDANRGECTHSCRWKYSVVEEKRPGEYMPVYENERGTYIFNSKDLCMIEYIPELIEAGIDSFKIEGRMKTALYVATVARTYRKAIDDYLKSPETFKENLEWYKSEIGKCTYREFTTGFFFGKPDSDTQIYDSNTYVKNYIYIGTVNEVDEKNRAIFNQKNRFFVGDNIEIMKKNGENISLCVESIEDEKDEKMESAPHPMQLLKVTFDKQVAEEGDILRIYNPERQ